MAKPYREGKGWSVRLRVRGHDLYLSGFTSEAAARRAAEARRADILKAGAPAHQGPTRTRLGQAFAQYARERLPYLKSSNKDANRLNAYLRACALPVIVVEPHSARSVSGSAIYWKVDFEHESERKIVTSLRAHRSGLSEKFATSARVRERLARMTVADITYENIKALTDAMADEGYQQASIINERAELNRLFNHARRVWRWTEPACNPVAAVKLKAPDNARDRVLTNEEWDRVLTHLNAHPNRFVAPAVVLLLETSMRCSEALVTATWGSVDWERNTLLLSEAKAGARKVPLSPGAVDVLRKLRAQDNDICSDGRILKTTYEALKKAWSVVRKAADIKDVRLHDLRHTSTTRFALEYQGNLPVLKLISGHKTTAMLMRYINIKAENVASMMHGKKVDLKYMPAGYKRNLLKQTEAQASAKEVQVESAETQAPDNLVAVDFVQRRRSA
ncbi:MAG: hypothetical protein C0607_19755 [Azoarcus sp.]|nr:MAG: hypothetical protein C0607_19755 [Azoarcus sp.]